MPSVLFRRKGSEFAVFSNQPNGPNKITKNQAMVCDVCGQSEARQRYISRSYGEGESLLVIEGVPVISCPHCGGSYLTAHTLHEIERIKRQRERLAVKRSVSVVVFT